MDVIEMLRVAVDDLVGNRGAVRNCRDELYRRADDEAKVDRLSRRLPATTASTTSDAVGA